MNGTKRQRILFIALALFAGSGFAQDKQLDQRTWICQWTSETAASTPLFAVEHAIESLAVSADGKSIALCGSVDGSRHLKVYNRFGQQLADFGPGGSPAWSPRGERLAWQRTGADPGVTLSKWQPGRLREDSVLDRLGQFPSWSPDGLQLSYFRPDRSKSDQPVLIAFDFAEDRYQWSVRDSFCANVSLPTAWSPDSKRLALAVSDPCRLVIVERTDSNSQQNISLPKSMQVDSLAWQTADEIVIAANGRLIAIDTKATPPTTAEIPGQPEDRRNHAVCRTAKGLVFASAVPPSPAADGN